MPVTTTTTTTTTKERGFNKSWRRLSASAVSMFSRSSAGGNRSDDDGSSSRCLGQAAADDDDDNIMARRSSSMRTISISEAKRIVVPAAARRVHLVVLVHGILGTPSEMKYLQKSMQDRFELLQEDCRSSDRHPTEDYLLVHSAECNNGCTHDGIAAGGSRLAQEVRELIQSLTDQRPNLDHVSLSFVGNSLGGLYARYALAELDDLLLAHQEQQQQQEHQQPAQHDCYSSSAASKGPDASSSSRHGEQEAGATNIRAGVFYTTATPHLGTGGHTYLPLPRCCEYVVANALQATGRDLFRYTDIVERLATDPAFRRPLTKFRKRVAYANAYHTDFQVPTTTAAFLSKGDDSVHRRVFNSGDDHDNQTEQPPPPPFVALQVETPQRRRSKQEDELAGVQQGARRKRRKAHRRLSSDDLALELDSLGWTKVFCDVRQSLTSIPVSASIIGSNNNNKGTADDEDRFFIAERENDDQVFSSTRLHAEFVSRSVIQTGRWYVPSGHEILVANAKDESHARRSVAGQPIMDKLASDVLRDILLR